MSIDINQDELYTLANVGQKTALIGLTITVLDLNTRAVDWTQKAMEKSGQQQSR